MAMAKQTQDPGLLRLVERLTKVLGLKTNEEPENEIQFTQHEELISVEPTARRHRACTRGKPLHRGFTLVDKVTRNQAELPVFIFKIRWLNHCMVNLCY